MRRRRLAAILAAATVLAAGCGSSPFPSSGQNRNPAFNTGTSAATPGRSVDIPRWTGPEGYTYTAKLTVGDKQTTNDRITCGTWVADPPPGAYYIPLLLTISDGGNAGRAPLSQYMFVVAPSVNQLGTIRSDKATEVAVSNEVGEFNSGCRMRGWPVQLEHGGTVQIAGSLAVDPKRFPSDAVEIGLQYFEEGKQYWSYVGIPVDAK